MYYVVNHSSSSSIYFSRVFGHLILCPMDTVGWSVSVVTEPSTAAFTAPPGTSNTTRIVDKDGGGTGAVACANYRFGVSVILMGFLCIFGMAGNLISLAVLQRLRRTSGTSGSPALLLTALSTGDFLVLASFLLLKVTPSLCAYQALCYEYFDTYMWIALYGWPTLSMLHCLATWLTVLLTIHRYIAVCHPLKVQAWGSLSKTRVHILMVTACSVLYNVPGYLDYTAVRYTDEWNQTAYRRVLTSIGANQWYQVVYKTASYFILIYLIPVVMLLVLGAFLVRSLAEAAQFRLQTTHSITEGTKKSPPKVSAKEDMTRIMVFIVVIHIITQPWEPIRRLLSEKLLLDSSCGHFLFYFDEIPSLMAVVNSAVNFAVYCFVGSRFRRICKDICCCRKKASQSARSTTSCSTEQLDESFI